MSYESRYNHIVDTYTMASECLAVRQNELADAFVDLLARHGFNGVVRRRNSKTKGILKVCTFQSFFSVDLMVDGKSCAWLQIPMCWSEEKIADELSERFVPCKE